MDKFKELYLTDEETAVVLKIAKRAGKDRDGDILHIYVQDDHGIAKLILWVPELVSGIDPTLYPRPPFIPADDCDSPVYIDDFAQELVKWPKQGYLVTKVEERDGGIEFTVDTNSK